jgi:ADP-ribosylglycohydrolase
MTTLSYEKYLDAVLGGWIGKSMGGAIGARFEGNKNWIEIKSSEMFPDKMPPNDDLDLQVLWLKVLEEKGPALTSDDLAEAWLQGCWYPFNEYGIFRRNWQFGIHPPYSGSFGNQFWETGMGCPIRAEIWGYIFPGAPHLAAKFAEMDGVLDHTSQAVGAEKMFAAMAAMAFFIPDVRRLSEMFMHYLPAGSRVEQLVRVAFHCHDSGASLREAHETIMLAGGCSEACDVVLNVPFTFLGLLYGQNDLEATMLAALKCGYDTDCTLATSAALLGQIMGAKRVPGHLLKAVGDELVMGIEYSRQEMTLSALARDTARIGVLFAQYYRMMEITSAPAMKPLPPTAQAPATRITIDYLGLPAAAPGDSVQVRIKVEGDLPGGSILKLQADSPGWTIVPTRFHPTPDVREFGATLHAPTWNDLAVPLWPQKHLFQALLSAGSKIVARYQFGIAGAACYQLLGVYYDAVPPEGGSSREHLRMCHHFVSLKRDYLPEPEVDLTFHWKKMQRQLGKQPWLASYEHEIDITKLVGLSGACCAYLSRIIVSPDEREVFLAVGNSDGVRLYLNGERIFEADDVMMWSPFNNSCRARLKKGENRLLVKMIRRGDACWLTLGFKSVKRDYVSGNDWIVDLADAIPSFGRDKDRI